MNVEYVERGCKFYWTFRDEVFGYTFPWSLRGHSFAFHLWDV